MAEIKKTLHMAFETTQGGTFRIAVGNTKDGVDKDAVVDVMEDIVAAKVFETDKGEVAKKAKAYFVTQETEDLEI